jgi:hypothetical protein
MWDDGDLDQPIIIDPIPPGEDMWGWSEGMGWRQKEEVGLADLGDIAELRYRLLDDADAQGTAK